MGEPQEKPMQKHAVTQATSSAAVILFLSPPQLRLLRQPHQLFAATVLQKLQKAA
jgi:hypothetical protein